MPARQPMRTCARANAGKAPAGALIQSSVAILGSGGAGKTTLAAELAGRTGLPVVYLDALYWAPDWVPRPPDEFRAALDAAVAEDRWILDGNVLWGDADDPRFGRVDTALK